MATNMPPVPAVDGAVDSSDVAAAQDKPDEVPRDKDLTPAHRIGQSTRAVTELSDPGTPSRSGRRPVK